MADGGGRNDDVDFGQPNVARRNPEGTGTTQPQALDVLLGRGRRNAFHPGNRRYHAIIEMNQARFNAATSRLEKTQIAQEIVNLIAERGRLLKFEEQRGGWVEVDNEVARTKVSHACRYRQRRQPAARSFPPPIVSAADVAATAQAVRQAGNQAAAASSEINSEHSSPEEPP